MSKYKRIVSIDTETTGLITWKGDRPFGIGIAEKIDGEIVTDYIDCRVDPFTRTVDWTTTSRPEKLNEIKAICEDEDIVKVFHHAKFDIRMLESIGIKVNGPIHDTQFAARVCNTLEYNYKLKPLAKKYLNIDNSDEKILKDKTIKVRAIGKNKGWLLGDKVPEDYWMVKIVYDDNNLCEVYCRQDVYRALMLWEFYEEGMEQLNVRFTYDKEIKLLRIIYELETRGIYCNPEVVTNQMVFCMKRLREINEILTAKYGEINLDSPQQLGILVARKLKLPVTERNKPNKEFPRGAPKVDNIRLRRYKHPDLDLVLEAKALNKGLSDHKTYLKFLTADNLIHVSLNQSNAKTWRLSCNDPNLQSASNPETNDNPYSVSGRMCFGPRPGYIWVAGDYSQVELRIFADRSNEDKLLDAFRNGRDPHNETRVNVPFLKAKDPKVGRKLAKNTNFTVINCGGKKVLYEKYDVPLDEGAECIRGFFYAYPKSKYRQQSIEAVGKAQGYIRNAFNRRLVVDRQFAYRATSYDIQSSAADLMKNGMLRCYDFCNEMRHCGMAEIHMVLSIHDELIFEVKEDDFQQHHQYLIPQIQARMENHQGVFSIPMPTDVVIITQSWDKKVSYAQYCESLAL